MKTIKLVFSCEHAVNTVPENFQSLFNPWHHLLATHRGVDFGALAIASYLSEFFKCELISAKATRLLIDCNRSLNNPACFSEITNPLSKRDKESIIDVYYLPFRKAVESQIEQLINAGNQVLHLSIHSFTPVYEGVTRNADIGLLYDPARPSEKQFSKLWQQELKLADPQFRVRLNYPYRGTSNGFTCALRKKHPDKNYVGIELESNQALVEENHNIAHLACMLAASLQAALKRS